MQNSSVHNRMNENTTKKQKNKKTKKQKNGGCSFTVSSVSVDAGGFWIFVAGTVEDDVESAW